MIKKILTTEHAEYAERGRAGYFIKTMTLLQRHRLDEVLQALYCLSDATSQKIAHYLQSNSTCIREVHMMLSCKCLYGSLLREYADVPPVR